jgi:hypothetical protein
MAAIEREITREQAKLLFDLPDDGVYLYELRLVPKVGRMLEQSSIEPFATEQEAEDFTARFSKRLINAAW